MNKDLTTLQTDSKIVISKTKSLLSLKNKLIPKKEELLDESWMERLWQWADKNEIPDFYYQDGMVPGGIPRDKNRLLENFRGLVIMITQSLLLFITPYTAGCDSPNTLLLLLCSIVWI